MLTIAPDGVRRPVGEQRDGLHAGACRIDSTIKDRLMREGRWKEKGDYLGYGLTGKKLGRHRRRQHRQGGVPSRQALGHGASRLRSQRAAAAVTDLGVKMVDLDTLLREADVISVNCLLNDETQHLIGARAVRTDEAARRSSSTPRVVRSWTKRR